MRWRFRLWLQRRTGFPPLAKGETDYGARIWRQRLRGLLRVLESGYETPEEAARGDIPARFARVSRVEYSKAGDRACVWLLTNDEPYLYPYTVYCGRDERGRWQSETGWSGHTDTALTKADQTRCTICGEPIDDGSPITFGHKARYGLTGRYRDIPGWIMEDYVAHSRCEELQQADSEREPGPVLREE